MSRSAAVKTDTDRRGKQFITARKYHGLGARVTILAIRCPALVTVSAMNLGTGEIIMIAVAFLVLFGAGKFADIGKGLGQGIRNFKAGIREAGEDEARAAREKLANAEKSGDKPDA